MFSLRQPSEAALAEIVAEQSARRLSYPQVGATAAEVGHEAMPPGYAHDRWTCDLGAFDEELFVRAATALGTWAVQRGAGITVFPSSPVEPGLTFALALKLPVGYVKAAGRVVYVTDEPGRYGFAYGTLPAHPEQGEEAFHLSRNGARLTFTVAAFSRPRHPLARLGAPVARALQLRTTKAYQRAMQGVLQ